MRKIYALTLVMVMLLTMSTLSFANDHIRTTELTSNKSEILVGGSVTFTANTLKHGSNYANPTWYLIDDEGNRTAISAVDDQDITSTVFEADYYTSSRSIKFNQVGTFIVEFEITMAAGKGKSNVQFVATDRVTVVVSEPVTSEVKVVNFDITKYMLYDVNDTNTQIIILELKVYYSDDTTKMIEISETIGKWEADTKKTFTYEGISKSLKSADLPDLPDLQDLD
jgi:hypothetical protein